MLHLIVRFGATGAALLAPLIGIAVAFSIASLFGWRLIAIAVAVAVAGLTYVLLKSFVELITLIVDMLIPR